MELPGYDLKDGWLSAIPKPWKLTYITYDSYVDRGKWGVKLENDETGQFTLAHYDPSASEAVRRASEEALLIKAPNCYRSPSASRLPRPTLDSLLSGL